MDEIGRRLLSRAAVSEITEKLWAEYEESFKRDLSSTALASGCSRVSGARLCWPPGESWITDANLCWAFGVPQNAPRTG